MEVHETPHAENTTFIDSTTYRVNFWKPSGQVWELQAYVLTQASAVTEVLEWVEENRHGRRVEVFAEMKAEPVTPGVPRTAGLVRLIGENPNAGKSVRFGSFVREQSEEP